MLVDFRSPDAATAQNNDHQADQFNGVLMTSRNTEQNQLKLSSTISCGAKSNFFITIKAFYGEVTSRFAPQILPKRQILDTIEHHERPESL
jgi:hypothetical protein